MPVPSDRKVTRVNLEPMGHLGGQGAWVPLGMRVSLASQDPPERRARLETRAIQAQMEPLETGAALGNQAPRALLAFGGPEETRVKLDPQGTRAEKAPWVSPETRVMRVPSDPKGTEATRGPLGLRVPKVPQDPLDPLETLG